MITESPNSKFFFSSAVEFECLHELETEFVQNLGYGSSIHMAAIYKKKQETENLALLSL
jgi:hypothetical protein